MEQNQKFIHWEEIEPLCILRLLRRNLWLILLAALIGMLGTSIFMDTLVTRTYTSTATFVVTPRSGTSIYYVNTAAASDVAEIYSQLLQSNAMSQTVSEVLDGMNGTISAQQLGDTNLIRVSAVSPSPKDALLIIQTIVDHYAELSDYVSSTAVLSVLDTPSVTAISSRVYNEHRLQLIAALGCACAMTAALVWICVSSGTVQTSAGAKNNLDAKIIATVPHERSVKKKKLFQRKTGKRLRGNLNITSPAVSFPFVEAIHRISTKFEHERSKGKKVFLFSSVSEAEGKSTLAANTALSLCSRKHKVLFVDLDLRRPVQNEFFNAKLSRNQELGTLLADGSSPADILDAAIFNPETGMSTLLSAKSYVDTIELISSPLLAQVLNLARTRFDFIIIDSPPLGYFSDSEQLSDLSDLSVLVVRQDTVPAPEVNDAIDALRSGKAEFLGCILNDMRHLHARLSGYGYGYGYGGKYYGKYGKYGKYGYAANKKAE